MGKVKDKVSGGRCEGRDVHLGKEFSASGYRGRQYMWAMILEIASIVRVRGISTLGIQQATGTAHTKLIFMHDFISVIISH
jgi:hypothetical protein